MVSYDERIKILRDRNVPVDHLFSDWCVDCKHSDRIVPDNGGYVCSTGCNGLQEFVQNSDGSRKFTGKKPLGYEKEEEVEDI